MDVYTKQQWIAEQARTHPERVFTSLHHLIDREWMVEAWTLTRKDGAAGVDGMTAADYERDLEANLSSLRDRIVSGRYVAPPVRRHFIPKADGTKRPLGIPTVEDKVAQRAIVMLLEPIFEQDFMDCSFGFRPGRSAHDAIRSLQSGIMETGQRWVIDADISKYFDQGELRLNQDHRRTGTAHGPRRRPRRMGLHLRRRGLQPRPLAQAHGRGRMTEPGRHPAAVAIRSVGSKRATKSEQGPATEPGIARSGSSSTGC